MATPRERTRAAIADKIQAIIDGQFRHADAIEKALTAYDRNIRIRSVSDYVNLSKHLRLIADLSTDKTGVEHTGDITTTVVFRVQEQSK